MPYSALSHLDCPRCGARHDADLRQVAVSPRDIYPATVPATVPVLPASGSIPPVPAPVPA